MVACVNKGQRDTKRPRPDAEGQPKKRSDPRIGAARDDQLDKLDAFLEQIVRIELSMDKPEDEDIDWPDFDGLYYPFEYVRDTWMQNRRHGTFPRDGAFNDQDPKWYADMKAFNARYNAWFEYLLREKHAGRSGRDVLDKLVKQNGHQPSVETLLGD